MIAGTYIAKGTDAATGDSRTEVYTNVDELAATIAARNDGLVSFTLIRLPDADPLRSGGRSRWESRSRVGCWAVIVLAAIVVAFVVWAAVALGLLGGIFGGAIK